MLNEILGRNWRARALVRRGNQARNRADWPAAEDAYRDALALRPNLAPVWIQHGHAVKEQGNPASAERSYRKAIAIDDRNADTWVQLGHALKLQGRIHEAVAAYADALRRDPAFAAARHELTVMGARDAIPDLDAGVLTGAAEAMAVSRSFDAMQEALNAWINDAPRPPRRYDEFRRAYPIAPPPTRPEADVHVIVDASHASPAATRATLLRLRDQSMPGWRATVFGSEPAGHPLESLAQADRRIRFDAIPTVGEGEWVLFMSAGVLLDPYAFAWLLHAANVTGADAVYADDDQTLPHWREGGRRSAPRFFPVYDPWLFAELDEPPLIVMSRPAHLPADLASLGSAETRRAMLEAADQGGGAAHVPRLLASRQLAPLNAHHGRDDIPSVPALRARTKQAPSDKGVGRLSIIIPTRDMASMLDACVRSLRASAAHPGRLEFVIVDNRSVEPETAALLKAWARDPSVRVVSFDEPFNWPRANAAGLAVASGEAICFVNNDTEMLSTGWDDRIGGLLARPGVGVVGARLLYPDRTVQHAGIVFGVGQGSPVHEGVGAAADDPGPLGRWHRLRQVPAVTGAFLAVTRAVHDEIGGFDGIELPIGFNDVDFCLKVRNSGRSILYDPAIEMIHHESRTRGRNDTMGKLAWDHGELESFHRRWGDEMMRDPGYNPCWALDDVPFSGIREPGPTVIDDHILASASPMRWLALPPGSGFIG